MRAALRMVWLYGTLFPVQRWLAVIAGVLAAIVIGAAVFAALVSSPARAAGLVAGGLMLPAALLFTPACFVAGAALRLFSAPPTHRLLPRLRIRLLGSVLLLTAVVVATAMTPFLVFAALPDEPGAPPLGWALLFVCATLSGVLYAAFRVLHANALLFVEIVVFVILAQWLGRVVDPASAHAALPWALLGLLLAGWLAFGVWYLRAARIAGANLAGAGARPLAVDAGGGGPGAPARLLLQGRMAPARWRLLSGAVIGGVLTGGMLRLIVGEDPLDAMAPMPVEPTMVVVLGLGSALNLNYLGARARYLWLLGCGTRADLFRRVEATAVDLFSMSVLLVVSLLVTLHFWVRPVPAVRFAAAILLIAGFAPIAVYLGLYRTRNVGLRDAALGLLALVVSMTLYFGFVGGIWPLPVVIAVTLVQLTIAAWLRAVARRRWERVDWLDYRVFRPANLAFGRQSRS